jgi:hypothetical protein
MIFISDDVKEHASLVVHELLSFPEFTPEI